MVIANGVVYDVDGKKEVDIRIENGKIVEFGQNLQDDKIIDVSGSYILPSLIDTNVSLLDDTLNAKNIQILANEASQGGVGKVVLNATSTPSIDDEIVLEFAQNALHNLKGAKVELMINALQEDLSLSNIAILLKGGAVAPYMSTIAKNDVAIKVAEYVKMYNVTLFCKAEDNSLINAGVMLDGDVSSKLGLAGIPELSEVLHVSRMIEIAKYFSIKILFKSIASPRSLELITQAKKDGIDVSCEVSIAHLTLSDKECEGFNTLAKLNPPLSSEDDVVKLQKALKNGEVDILTTLHKPHSLVNKEVAFYDAAYGSAEICNALSLYYTHLVKTQLISFEQLLKLTVQNPAKAIGKERGRVQIGDDVDLIIFNPTLQKEVTNKKSLYCGKSLYGKVTHHIVKEDVESF